MKMVVGKRGTKMGTILSSQKEIGRQGEEKMMKKNKQQKDRKRLLVR